MRLQLWRRYAEEEMGWRRQMERMRDEDEVEMRKKRRIEDVVVLDDTQIAAHVTGADALEDIILSCLDLPDDGVDVVEVDESFAWSQRLLTWVSSESFGWSQRLLT